MVVVAWWLLCLLPRGLRDLQMRSECRSPALEPRQPVASSHLPASHLHLRFLINTAFFCALSLAEERGFDVIRSALVFEYRYLRACLDPCSWVVIMLEGFQVDGLFRCKTY